MKPVRIDRPVGVLIKGGLMSFIERELGLPQIFGRLYDSGDHLDMCKLRTYISSNSIFIHIVYEVRENL